MNFLAMRYKCVFHIHYLLLIPSVVAWYCNVREIITKTSFFIMEPVWGKRPYPYSSAKKYHPRPSCACAKFDPALRCLYAHNCLLRIAVDSEQIDCLGTHADQSSGCLHIDYGSFSQGTPLFLSYLYRSFHLIYIFIQLTFSTLWANSAEDKLMTVFSFF